MRIYGPLDSDVAVPVKTGTLIHVDASAIQEIKSHCQVVGSTPWTGMQGTGQITYGTDSTSAYSATLSINGDKAFRLDAQTLDGALSIKINGKVGIIQQGEGKPIYISAATAASGLLQFEMPRLANFPGQATSLTDRGSMAIDGDTLHRITTETPLTSNAADVSRDPVVTDLYFDSTSHLLIKSANSIRLEGAGKNEFLRVITYEDYRSVGGSLVPFRYTQTLNGQKQWTLQLSDVQLNPDLPASLFEF
jgi:hypothetical protein